MAKNEPQSTWQPAATPSGARDAEGFRAAVAGAFAPVRRYLFGCCGNWHEAEDLAGDVLLKAWRARARFDGRAKAMTWIFTIARNHWRDRLRRRRVRPAAQPLDLAAEPTGPAASPHAAAVRSERARAVRRAVGRLPDEQREALALRESRGLTFAEIAELLGVPAATVKSRVRYALLKLADELKPFRDDRPEAES